MWVGNVLVFYLPTARPDRSAARQPMLQSFPRAPWLPRNHAPPVGGAAKQPLLQTIPGPTLEVAFRVSIGCKYKTRTKLFPGKCRAWRFGVQVWAHNLRIYDAQNKYFNITFLINDPTLNCSDLINITYLNLMKHKSN